MSLVLQGAGFSEHLDQFRLHPGAAAYSFTCDPKDHTHQPHTLTIWAPDYATAELIARQMCREFGLEYLSLEQKAALS